MARLTDFFSENLFLLLIILYLCDDNLCGLYSAFRWHYVVTSWGYLWVVKTTAHVLTQTDGLNGYMVYNDASWEA